MEQYPSELIRGIANSNELDDEGNATINLFQFRENPLRNDNKVELSINWCDDKIKALSLVMNQRKLDESYQFKAGAAIISRDKLDDMRKTPYCKGKLYYERAPIENNEFHGNVTCTAGLPKPTMHIIKASLVLSVTSIFTRDCTI